MSELLILLFSQSAPVQLLMLAIYGLVSGALALAFLAILRRAQATLASAIPVATFLSTIATAWALALGFAAADVWSARGHAEQAASEERSSVLRLVGMAEQDTLDIPEILQALNFYAREVRDDEWGSGLNRNPVEAVDQALQQIRVSIVRLAEQDVSPALIAKMTNDFDELQDARNQRLAIGSSSVSQYKWYLVLFLTFLAMISIAVVHADRPLAARNALGIFMVASTVSLWILALHATPYAGSAGITFHELQLPASILQ